MSLEFVIDGYNIIKHPLLNKLLKPGKDPHLALFNFIKLNHLTGSAKNKLTVVFDGYPNNQDGAVFSKTGLVFSKSISADEKIKHIVEGSLNPKNLIVVSDDKEVRISSRMLRAKVMGVAEFLSLREKLHYRKEEDIKEDLSFSQKQKINEELRKIWL